MLGSLDILSKIPHLSGLELQIITAFAATGMIVETVANKLCPGLFYVPS
jgi:hypothetical protein